MKMNRPARAEQLTRLRMDFEVHRQGAEFQPLVDGIKGDLRNGAERRTESQRRVGPWMSVSWVKRRA